VDWLRQADFERDVKGQFRTAEHSIGITIFNWLALRSGGSTIEPDVHVLRFVETVIGRRPSPEETITALRKLANELGMKPFRLDSAIWHIQRHGNIPAEDLHPGDAVISPEDVKLNSTVLVVSSYDGEEYLGKVIEIDHHRIKVTFPGWSHDWDESLLFSAIRFPESRSMG
jgi:hypothetical protein